MYGSWGLGLGPMFLAGPTEAAGLDVGLMPCLRIFLYIYLLYHDFAKIYSPTQNFAKIYILRRGPRH
jgi:hypothetical protein